MHKRYIKTVLILYNIYKRLDGKLAKKSNREKKVKIVLQTFPKSATIRIQETFPNKLQVPTFIWK